MDSAIKVLQLYEANYPEFLHKVFIVNGNTCTTADIESSIK